MPIAIAYNVTAMIFMLAAVTNIAASFLWARRTNGTLLTTLHFLAGLLAAAISATFLGYTYDRPSWSWLSVIDPVMLSLTAYVALTAAARFLTLWRENSRNAYHSEVQHELEAQFKALQAESPWKT